MFSTNGRINKTTASHKSRDNASGKEFICSSCDNKKRVNKVEFGEAILCEVCGQPMVENHS